jgi:hypothetical protein
VQSPLTVAYEALAFIAALKIWQQTVVSDRLPSALHGLPLTVELVSAEGIERVMVETNFFSRFGEEMVLNGLFNLSFQLNF